MNEAVDLTAKNAVFSIFYQSYDKIDDDMEFYTEEYVEQFDEGKDIEETTRMEEILLEALRHVFAY